MNDQTDARSTYQLFRISVLIKAAISIAEILAGIIAFFVPLSIVTDLIASYAKAQLAENPGNFIASHFLSLTLDAALISGTFIAVYLLSRGLIKLVLIWAMLNDKLWAYPLSLIVLGLFVIYQLYELFTGHSIIIVAITLFDLVVMYFIWKEYLVVKARHKE